MATKKKPKYYVYYDANSGVVTGVTPYPEPDTSYIEIPADIACNFINNTVNYSNYNVGIIKKNGKQVKGLVERQVVTYTPRVGMFDKISDGADKQDLIIEWNLKKKEWIVSLNTDDIGGLDSQLLFFVTRESDFNQLVATLVVNVNELTEGPVHVPFVTSGELDINKLEILSKLVLGSYGLRIVHD